MRVVGTNRKERRGNKDCKKREGGLEPSYQLWFSFDSLQSPVFRVSKILCSLKRFYTTKFKKKKRKDQVSKNKEVIEGIPEKDKISG